MHPGSKRTGSKLLLFFELKGSCDDETKADVALEEVPVCLGNECAFGESAAICHDQLEHVAACFNINAKAKRVVVWISFWDVEAVVVFRC